MAKSQRALLGDILYPDARFPGETRPPQTRGRHPIRYHVKGGQERHLEGVIDGVQRRSALSLGPEPDPGTLVVQASTFLYL